MIRDSSMTFFDFFQLFSGTIGACMSVHPSCDQACGAGACSLLAEQGPIVLAEALARFECEAQNGTCDTGRYRLNYSTWGAGPPLVFIHGASDVRRSFVMVTSRLAAQFR